MNIKHPRVKEAVNSLIFTHPFYASVLLQQEFVEDNNPKTTFWVDGKRFGYNANFVDTLNFEEIKGVCAHEVNHLVLLHHARMNNRDPEVWNQATDYVINSQLLRSGFKLPKGVLVDARFANTNAEDAYRTLMNEKKEEEKKQGKKNEQGKPDDNGQPSSGSGKGQPSDSQEDGNGDGEPSDDQGDGNGNSNNGKPANPCGEVRKCKDATPEELEQRAIIMGKMAENAAKLCGSMPAGLDRLLADVRKPVVDWREVLNRFLSEIAAKDYNFSRANKRFLGRGIILPSLYSKTIGKVVVALDTSGSISISECEKLLGEVTGMLESINETKTNAEIDIIYCDADVCGVDVYDGTNKFNVKGGGGTRFSPVFKYVEEHDMEPVCLIYLSDGECSDFGPEPDYPVIWAITKTFGDFKPPFGEVMYLTQ